MKLKEGVNLEGVQWQMFKAAVIAEAVFAKHGSELTITSANDSKHGPNTLHHKGLALDLRTWQVTGREGALIADLKRELGDDYDVVLESDHIHMEFDPT